MTHDLKILKQYADSVLDGTKTFEVRLNDRGYQKGDIIVFTVIDDKLKTKVFSHELNGKRYEITYVLSYKGLEEGYVALAIKEIDKAFLQQSKELAELKKGWIPVSERLPERNKDVLTWAKSTARGGDICFVGSCDNGCWFLQSSAGTLSYPTQYEVVAWMELPEPYKEEKNNE